MIVAVRLLLFALGVSTFVGMAPADEGPSVQPSNPTSAAAPLPAHALARLEPDATPSPLLGIYGITFSADGRRLATRSADQIVRVWDTAGGRILSKIDGHKDRILGMAFSPDGSQLATCSQGEDPAIRCWDPATGKPLREIAVGARHICFAPDGQAVRAVSDYGLVTYGADGKMQASSRWAHRPALALSADGQTIAVVDPSGGRQIQLLAPDGALRQTLQGHATTPLSAAFPPDGACLAITADRTLEVHVWHLRQNGRHQLLSGHTGPVQTLAFSPDARHLATASWDNTVRLWETASGQQLAVLPGHADHVCAVTISEDGRRLASGAAGEKDSSVLLWDVPALLFVPKQKLAQLSAAEQEELIRQLAAEDPRAAYAVVGSLIAAPEVAVPLLARQISGGHGQVDAEIRQLIRQLDDEDFKVREAAHQRLVVLRTEADALLREALRNSPSPEVKHRVEQILKKPLGTVTQQTEEQRRLMRRAVLVLEQIGNAAAQAQLTAIAAGPADQQHVQDAAAALKRLRK